MSKKNSNIALTIKGIVAITSLVSVALLKISANKCEREMDDLRDKQIEILHERIDILKEMVKYNNEEIDDLRKTVNFNAEANNHNTELLEKKIDFATSKVKEFIE
jgi:uncharacterized protein YlxW (UPF0749 family)